MKMPTHTHTHSDAVIIKSLETASSSLHEYPEGRPLSAGMTK